MITMREMYADERRDARAHELTRPRPEQLPTLLGPVCFCGSVTWHNPTCPTGIQRTYTQLSTGRSPDPLRRIV